MQDDGRCLKCGSKDRIPDVHVHGGFHARSIMVDVGEKPKSWFNKSDFEGVLTATVCGRCGFAELYVKNPEEMLAAYRQMQSPA